MAEMTEQVKRQNQRAMDIYNKMWRDYRAVTTQRLYKAAAINAKFGVHLQDEVLVRLGFVLPSHRSRKHYGKAARAFIEWMTETYDGDKLLAL